jgi:hypothetical protein
MENLGAAYWASDEGELATRIYFAAATGSMPAPAAAAEPAPKAAAAAGGGAPAGEAPGPEGEQKLSKNALKKLKNGKADKPAKKKDANQWAVDPAKAAAKAAEKAAKAKADAERNAAEAAAQVATPAGEKKILTKDLASVYMPEMVESAWQEWWEASGFYSADAAAGEAAGRDCDSTPQRDGLAALGPRPDGGHRRRADAVAPHEGRRDPVRAGHRPRGDCDAGTWARGKNEESVCPAWGARENRLFGLAWLLVFLNQDDYESFQRPFSTPGDV